MELFLGKSYMCDEHRDICIGIHPAEHDEVKHLREVKKQGQLQKVRSTQGFESIACRGQQLSISLQHYFSMRADVGVKLSFEACADLPRPSSAQYLLPMGEILFNSIQRLVKTYNQMQSPHRLVSEKHWCSTIVIAGNGLLEHLLREAAFELDIYQIPRDSDKDRFNMGKLWKLLADEKVIDSSFTVCTSNVTIDDNETITVTARDYSVSKPHESRNTIFHYGCQPSQYSASYIVALLRTLWEKLTTTTAAFTRQSSASCHYGLEEEVLAKPPVVRGFQDDAMAECLQVVCGGLPPEPDHDSASEHCQIALQVIEECLQRLAESYIKRKDKCMYPRGNSLKQILEDVKQLFIDHKNVSRSVYQLYNRLQTIRLFHKEISGSQPHIQKTTPVYNFLSRYMAMVTADLVRFCGCNTDETNRPVSFVSFWIEGGFPGYQADSVYSQLRANVNTKATEEIPGSGVFVYTSPAVEIPAPATYSVQAVRVVRGKATDHRPCPSLKVLGLRPAQLVKLEETAESSKYNLKARREEETLEITGTLPRLQQFESGVLESGKTKKSMRERSWDYVCDEGQSFKIASSGLCRVKFTCDFKRTTPIQHEVLPV